MTEDNYRRDSFSESALSTDSSAVKRRKRRKWDQPAESLVSTGVALPCILPLGNMASLPGAPLVHQQAAAVVQKLTQTKIQDELIAKEIVINDADSAIRCKLTKRQTQEEIQKSTGAVVITRGRYRPPNAPADGEKPLYLHISAGAHLETTVERIRAIDRAAAMVEEILKQGAANLLTKVSQFVSTSVFLGFEADPSLNVVARIRGPNDQYINHIMNETGATVLLRGHGAGDFDSTESEDEEQPLHLLLLSNNSKSLERAKLLAENLLDTISAEFGASRVSSNKVYGAVPPPQKLLTGVQDSENESKTNALIANVLTSNVKSMPPVQSISLLASLTTTIPEGAALHSQSDGLNYGQCQPSILTYRKVSVSGGTSYIGYGGIYPQATPLQQVAQALRQSASPVTSTVAASGTTAAATVNTSMHASSQEGKKPPQKRKFQELPVALKDPAKSLQNSIQSSELSKPCEPLPHIGASDLSTVLAPKKVVQPSSNVMPPPPLRSMPPPPPKVNSEAPVGNKHEDNNLLNNLRPEIVPDTLVKLLEYGDEDDDPDEITEGPMNNSANAEKTPKPFWAV